MRLSFPLLLTLMMLASATAAMAGETTVNLTPTGLAETGVFLTPANALSPMGTVSLPLQGGVILPSARVTVLDARTRGSILLSNSDCFITSVEGETPAFQFVPSKGAPLPMERMDGRGRGFNPVTFTLSNGQPYTLATPYFARRRGIGGTFYMRSGAARQGALGHAKLWIYDDNTDGQYSRRRDAYGYAGARALAPLTTRIAGPEHVYRIRRLAQDGTSITLIPVEEATSSLAVTFTHITLAGHMVFANPRGKLYVPVRGEGEAMTVLPGSYTLAWGLLFDPVRNRAIAGITPGSVKPLAIATDERRTLELGGPLTVTFTPKIGEGRMAATLDKYTGKKRKRMLTISGKSLALVGKAGEKYIGYAHRRPPSVRLICGKADIDLGVFTFG